MAQPAPAKMPRTILRPICLSIYEPLFSSSPFMEKRKQEKHEKHPPIHSPPKPPVLSARHLAWRVFQVAFILCPKNASQPPLRAAPAGAHALPRPSAAARRKKIGIFMAILKTNQKPGCVNSCGNFPIRLQSRPVFLEASICPQQKIRPGHLPFHFPCH
ncbi:MAG: hypothetical protein ACTTJV_05575 [Ottowia sp.]